jgi:hypothetical protein
MNIINGDDISDDIDSHADDHDTTISKKDYTYLIKNNAVIDANMFDLFGNVDNGVVYIIGYHITRESKYPFIQILLEKTIGKLCLPKIKIFSSDERSIEDIVLNHVNSLLLNNYFENRYETNKLKYSGIITDNDENIYALVDVSCLRLNSLFLNTNDSIWFALPTEIINKGSLNSLSIDSSIVDLFIGMPELSVLHYPDLKQVYIVPDVVYGEPMDIKMSELTSVLGIQKNKIYKSCGYYYFFYNSFDFVIREFKKKRKLSTNVNNNNNNNNNDDKEILYGINRYAIFPENYYNHVETNDELQLTDNDIWEKYKQSKCIYLHFMTDSLEYICDDSYKPNILIKEYENYLPLSFHYVV